MMVPLHHLIVWDMEVTLVVVLGEEMDSGEVVLEGVDLEVVVLEEVVDLEVVVVLEEVALVEMGSILESWPVIVEEVGYPLIAISLRDH